MASDKIQEALFPGPSAGSAVLTDAEIHEAIESGLLIDKQTYSRNSLEPCSYDIRIGAKGILGGQGVEIDLKASALELGPGTYAGIVSLERLILPRNIFARIGAKRFFSYEGVILLTGSL